MNIEIVTARKLRGSEQFLRVAEADAVRAGGTVHWGQSNELTTMQVESVFPRIDLWREVLARFTHNGRMLNFATDLSRTHGLEIVAPRIGIFRASWLNVCADEPVRFDYDAFDNPPGTSLRITVQDASGGGRELRLPDLRGHVDVTLRRGENRCDLTASFTFDGHLRETTQTILVRAFAGGDLVRLAESTHCLAVDGASHWAFETSLDPAAWSPALLAGNLSLSSDYRGAVIVRHPPAPDLVLTVARSGVDLLGGPTLAGTWTVFVREEGCNGPAPSLGLTVAARC